MDMEEKVSANPKGHSYSRINTFANFCERRHAFEALFPTPPNDAMRKGSHVHKGLEDMARAMRQTPEAGAHGAAEYAKAQNRKKKGFLPRAEFGGYMNVAVPAFRHLRPLEVEKWVTKIPGVSYTVRGRIDLISETTPIFDSSGLPVGAKEGKSIIDHKTLSRPAGMLSVAEAKKSLQLQMYALATGVKTVAYLYYLSASSPVHGVCVTFTDEVLELRKKWLTDITQVIESRWSGAKLGTKIGEEYNLSGFSLAPSDHPWCSKKYCPYWSRCFSKGDKK